MYYSKYKLSSGAELVLPQISWEEAIDCSAFKVVPPPYDPKRSQHFILFPHN